MNMELILLEEFRHEPREGTSLAGVNGSMNSDLRKWVAENLKMQFGGEDGEVEPSASEGMGCDQVAV